MSKLTPYAALCEIFKSKFLNEDATGTNANEFPKNPLKIDNSCQTQPLRDYSFDKVLKTPRKIVSLKTVTLKDDNFQILHPDYAAYSAEYSEIIHPTANKIKLVAEKPQEETDRFHFSSFAPILNKLRGKSPSPPKVNPLEVRNETTMTEPPFQERIITPRTTFPVNEPNNSDLIFPELNLYRNNNTIFETTEYSNNIPYNPYRESNQIHSHLKNPKINAVYRTVSDLRTRFEEKYEHCENNDKCMCEHCGAWNLVNDSLKRPQIFGNSEAPEEDTRKHHKYRKSKLNEKDYLKLIMKLKMMEERIHELEEMTYVQGPLKLDDDSITFDMYTQCKQKKKKAKYKETENSRSWSPRRIYRKNCPFPFGLPPSLFKRRSCSEDRDVRDTDSDEYKVEHESRPTKRIFLPKPKLRCQDYVNKKTEETTPYKKPGFWKSNKESFNIQIIQNDTEDNKAGNSIQENKIEQGSTIEINLDTITEKEVQDLLIKLNKRKILSHVPEAKPAHAKPNKNFKDQKIIFENNRNDDFASKSGLTSQNEVSTKYQRHKKHCSTIAETSKESSATSYDYQFLKQPDLIEKSAKDIKLKNIPRQQTFISTRQEKVPDKVGGMENVKSIMKKNNQIGEFQNLVDEISSANSDYTDKPDVSDYFNKNFSAKTSTTEDSYEAAPKSKKTLKGKLPAKNIATINETLPEQKKTETKNKLNVTFCKTDDSSKSKKLKTETQNTTFSPKNEQRNFIEFRRSFKQNLFGKKVNKDETKQVDITQGASEIENNVIEKSRKKWDFNTLDINPCRNTKSSRLGLDEILNKLPRKKDNKSEYSTKDSSRTSETDSCKTEIFPSYPMSEDSNTTEKSDGKNTKINYKTFQVFHEENEESNDKSNAKNNDTDTKMQDTTKKSSFLSVLKNFSKQLIPRKPKSILKPAIHSAIPKPIEIPPISKQIQNIQEPIKNIPKSMTNTSTPIVNLMKTTTGLAENNKPNPSNYLSKPLMKTNVTKSISKQTENVSKPIGRSIGNVIKPIPNNDEIAFKKIKPLQLQPNEHLVPKKVSEIHNKKVTRHEIRKTKTVSNDPPSKIPRYSPDRKKTESVDNSRSPSPEGKRSSRSISPEKYKNSHIPLRKRKPLSPNVRNFFHPTKEDADIDVLLSIKEISSIISRQLEEKCSIINETMMHKNLPIKNSETFDKYCMIKPEMIDKSTKLSNEHIPSEDISLNTDNLERPTTTALSINTIILNNIESLFSNTNRNVPLNNLIIFNPKSRNLPMITDVPNRQLNSLSIDTKIIQNLLPTRNENLVNNTQLVLYSTKNNGSLVSNASINEIKIRELNYLDDTHSKTHLDQKKDVDKCVKRSGKSSNKDKIVCGCKETTKAKPQKPKPKKTDYLESSESAVNAKTNTHSLTTAKKEKATNMPNNAKVHTKCKCPRSSLCSIDSNGSKKCKVCVCMNKTDSSTSIAKEKNVSKKSKLKNCDDNKSDTSLKRTSKVKKQEKEDTDSKKKIKISERTSKHENDDYIEQDIKGLKEECRCTKSLLKKQKCSICSNKSLGKKASQIGVDCDECLLDRISSNNVKCTKELCKTKCNKLYKGKDPKKKEKVEKKSSPKKLDKCSSKCEKGKVKCCEHQEIHRKDSNDSNTSSSSAKIRNSSESCCRLKNCPRKANKTRFKKKVTQLDKTPPKKPESKLYLSGSILKTTCEVCRHKHAPKNKIVTSETYLQKNKKKYSKRANSITGAIIGKDSACSSCCQNKSEKKKSLVEKFKVQKADSPQKVKKSSSDLVCEKSCRSVKNDSPKSSRTKTPKSDSEANKRRPSSEKIKTKKTSQEKIKSKKASSEKIKSRRRSSSELDKKKSSDSVKKPSPEPSKDKVDQMKKKSCEKCSPRLSKSCNKESSSKISRKKKRAPSKPECTCPPEARQLCVSGVCGNCRKEIKSSQPSKKSLEIPKPEKVQKPEPQHRKCEPLPKPKQCDKAHLSKGSSTSLPEKSSKKSTIIYNSSTSLNEGQTKVKPHAKERAPTPKRSSSNTCQLDKPTRSANISQAARQNLKQIKSKITSKFSCKYFKNLYRYPQRAVASVYRKQQHNNYCDVNLTEVKRKNEFRFPRERAPTPNKSSNKFFCPCLPRTTSSVIIYFYMGSSFYDNEDDDYLSWSNTDDEDVILTPEEKQQYLQEKLQLLQDYRSKISDASTTESNYGAFE